MQLDYILVVQDVVAFHRLAVENSRPPDSSRFQAGREIAMNKRRHVDDGASRRTRERGLHVGRFPRLLAVDPDHVQKPVERIAKLFQPCAQLRRDGWISNRGPKSSFTTSRRSIAPGRSILFAASSVFV